MIQQEGTLSPIQPQPSAKKESQKLKTKLGNKEKIKKTRRKLFCEHVSIKKVNCYNGDGVAKTK